VGSVTSVFERFTERARQVVILAQEEARTLKHGYIGTEHVLLGLLREEEGIAARVLESMDITVERVREWIIKEIGAGEEPRSGQIPFTPRAKKIFELALREALSLGHNYIGTEHILLGLVRENQGVAARILNVNDLDSGNIHNEVIRLLSGLDRRVREGVVMSPASKKGWVVTIGGVLAVQYIRKPNLRVHEGGVVEISGFPNEPILLRLANETIIIKEQVIE
jgi:ATP-dependent Clp protease ATP-binding subunit ClpC